MGTVEHFLAELSDLSARALKLDLLSDRERGLFGSQLEGLERRIRAYAAAPRVIRNLEDKKLPR